MVRAPVPAGYLTLLSGSARRFLADPRHRDEYPSRWAPLITVGTV